MDQPPDITIKTDPEKRRKVYVDGVEVTIIAERVEYLDENGKLVSDRESLSTESEFKLGDILYRRLAGVVIILSWAVLLSFLGASLACGYAAVIGDSWTDQTTTNNYFSFGPALPVVMPMHTFMQDWGVLLAF